jgi:hypothetical protein
LRAFKHLRSHHASIRFRSAAKNSAELATSTMREILSEGTTPACVGSPGQREASVVLEVPGIARTWSNGERVVQLAQPVMSWD